MKADAIKNVTIALKDRLQEAIDPLGIGQVFIGPLDDEQSKGAPLILFLYRITPNAFLRNGEHRVPSANGDEVEVYPNSLPLDLSFLLTVGTNPEGSEEIFLRAIGRALQSLQLHTDLTGDGLEHETVRLSIESLGIEEMGRIWSLFPTANYRTSIAILATPVWIDPDAVPASAGPVTTAGFSGGKS